MTRERCGLNHGRAQTYGNQSDVQFTKAVVCRADIRDQKPSLRMICPGDPHQRDTNASKFEDRFQEETEWQDRCAREAAWELTTSVVKTKGEKQSNILLTFENRCLPASTLTPEEREFVV